ELDQKPDDPELLNQLGILKSNASKYQEAWARFDQALNLARAAGQERIAISAEVNLAETQSRLGEFTKALTNAAKASRESDRHLGPEDGVTLSALTAHATILEARGDRGDLDRALDLRERLVSRAEKLWGKEAEETLAAKSNLALNLYRQGKLADAGTRQK